MKFLLFIIIYIILFKFFIFYLVVKSFFLYIKQITKPKIEI